jgi:hypothetical protein
MKNIYFVSAFLVLGSVSSLRAGCKDGTTVSCTLNGKQGEKECVNGRFTPCLVEPDTPPSDTGTAAPRYYILSVIYAPPGTKGGASSSSVNYGSGSTTGTTVTSANSFKQNYKVTATASGGILGNGTDVGTSFAYGRNSTDTSALDIKKSTASEIAAKGPGVDGIDHDRDQIWLWLNPKLRVTVTPTSASWTLQDAQTADIQFLFVGHLKNPALIPPGVLQRLQAFGITPQDYPVILKADPFANGATTLDTNRYQSLHTTFPYEPPFAQGDPPTTLKTTLSNATTNNATSSVQNDYTVGLSISGSTNFLSLFKASIKAESNWTWTDVSTTANSSSTTESAAVTVGGPSFGYTGPTDMGVYYDVLYKTFLFAPVTGPAQFKGTLSSRSRQALAGREVIVTANGRTFRTFTNARGEYRIPERISGPAELRVAGVTKQIPQAIGRVDVQIP